jgi:hypothetical protein
VIDDVPSPRLSIADARTLRELADAAASRAADVEPEHVAARAAIEVEDLEDPAVATVAAAEAMGRSPPRWAARRLAWGVE